VIPAHDGEEGEEGARLTLQLPDGKSQLERTQTIAGKVHAREMFYSSGTRETAKKFFVYFHIEAKEQRSEAKRKM
jgi:hypothetical protein